MRVSLFLLLMVALVENKRAGGGRGRGTGRSRLGGGTKGFRAVKKIATVGAVERTALFRSTILGAAAGYITFRAGKNIINDASAPMSWSDREYYWDSRFMPAEEDSPTQCINQIDPGDPQLGKVFFDDEYSRPTEIVYGCGEGEICCGFECCPDTSFFKSLFSLLVLILVLSVLGVFFIEAFRWAVNCFYNCRHKRSREFQVLSI